MTEFGIFLCIVAVLMLFKRPKSSTIKNQGGKDAKILPFRSKPWYRSHKNDRKRTSERS